MRVLLPSSTEPQVMNLRAVSFRLLRWSWLRVACIGRAFFGCSKVGGLSGVRL